MRCAYRFPTQVCQNMEGGKNSVASVRKQTIPTDRPTLVGEVSAKFWG
jgi:hypothetical protein